MRNFQNLTQVNGFDYNNLNNARQNNYAWSMSELGDFIYVGTGRNILLNVIKSINERTQIPALVNPGPVDNLAEIWRYKKDGTLPWEEVFKASGDSGIFGFRFMIQHRPFGGSPCIYAAAYGSKVQILKTTNGVNWFTLQDNVLQGTSSRAMVIQKGKIYLATINELTSGSNQNPLLYSSKDPEFYPWELVTDYSSDGFDPDKNPKGAISNMEVFNNRIYVATSNSDGVQVWRTNGAEPKLNDWTLIVDKGFGDSANKYSLSIGVFKDYLYVSGTKQLPLAWLIPMGCDIIRIDKYDNWQLIVGGNPLIPLTPSDREKRKSLSGLGSGFNNPFNVYAWQIQEYKDRLLISTFDDSSNMEVILDTLLANRSALERQISAETTNILIKIYRNVVKILRAIKYPIGFDLYMSYDGVHFSSVVLKGLWNPHNYGGRILYVDGRNELYIGTANPFQGCEVWKANDIENYNLRSYDENHYRSLWKARELINENYSIISDNMPAILKFLQKEHYHIFINDDKQ
ncbi:MAG: hypothetical protein K0R54_3659 [Clostridiaceae bacterium]|nr:hypothetical protein [Clostridiaceae bacterium]